MFLTDKDDVQEYKIQQLEILQAAYEKLNTNKMRERDIYKAHYDKTHKPVEFTVGDQVMLFTPRTEVGLSTSFLAKWNGPYTVVHKISAVNYRIESHCKKKKPSSTCATT